VLAIASEAVQAGCGTIGAEVTLSVSGRAASPTVRWVAGLQETTQVFVIGAEFAEYFGRVVVGDNPMVGASVVPYVGEVQCGEMLQGDLSPYVFGEWRYVVVVDSNEKRAGCGRPGANITLRLSVTNGSAVDLGQVAWEPGTDALMLSTVDVSVELAAPSRGATASAVAVETAAP
jgi:hypothetical protein